MTRASYIALAVVAGELIAAWLLGLCTNKLFVFFLATATVTLLLALPRSRIVLVALPAMIALIFLGRLWSGPVATHHYFNKDVIEVAAEEGFRYDFDLEPLLKRREQCLISHTTSDTKLFIHGKNLARARIYLNEVEQTQAQLRPFHDVLDHLSVDLPPRLTRFRATVKRDIGEPIPAINVGPYFRDDSLYAEAVFVVWENAVCRLVLHARRDCKESCPEIIASLSMQVLVVK